MVAVGAGMAVAVMVSLYIFYTLWTLFYPESALARPEKLIPTWSEWIFMGSAGAGSHGGGSGGGSGEAAARRLLPPLNSVADSVRRVAR